MGCDINFTCKTCGINYYLGRPGRCDDKDLLVHQNFKKYLLEHQNHDFLTWSYDWGNYVEDGDLWQDSGHHSHLLCKGYGQFKQVDLEEKAVV